MSGLKPEDDALIGTIVVGKYRIDRLIGRGGMGAVFQATNTAIGKRVALKFLDREAARDLDSVARFQREAESAGAIESAHIVHIFDTGSSDDRPFLVMELLSGEDLRARLRRDARVALPEVVHIAGQVLRALVRAHAEGIVHRDLKPDNIFLCQRDDDPMFVKIVDFGISKVSRKLITADTLTRRGVVLGTAFYMSPEQAQAFRDIDGRTDLYSLGTIMYEALAGRPPHIGSAYEAVLIDICTKDADDVRKHAPDVPQAIAEVIARALERDRDRRFQSAQEFYEALALAAPGLLRTSGPTSRDPLTSSPEGKLVTPPAAASVTPPSTKQDKPATLGTGEGTAVRPSRADSGVQRRRTIVIALVAALGTFAGTVFLMAKPSASGPNDGTRGTAASAELAPLAAPVVTPDASASAPRVAPVGPAASGTQSPSIKTARPIPGKPTGPKPPATAASAKPPAAGTSGVASGLTLDPTPP
jgi:eukaryotic-like serine/threonine-protein kinase